jgi:hypothetical protein
MSKLLLICSDASAFTKEVRYSLKDKYKLYCSEEQRGRNDADKQVKLASSNLVIIDAVNDRADLKLIANLAEWKKIAVLREHESRTSSWIVSQNAVVFDAVCKYKNHHLLTDFADVDTLVKTLKTSELEIDSDWRFYAKRFLKGLLFCLHVSG